MAVGKMVVILNFRCATRAPSPRGHLPCFATWMGRGCPCPHWASDKIPGSVGALQEWNEKQHRDSAPSPASQLAFPVPGLAPQW